MMIHPNRAAKAYNYLWLLIFTGCGTIMSSGDIIGGVDDVTATRMTLRRHDSLQPHAAFGFLLIPSGTGPARIRAVCDAYVATLPLDESIAAVGLPPSKRAPTLWPVLTDIDDRWAGCAELIAAYDFSRADVILRRLQLSVSEGPVLAAWQGPFASSNGDVLLFDMSRLETPEFDDAFRLWRGQIVRDPSIWDSAGWKVQKARLVCKSFTDKYGDGIVSSVASVGKAFFAGK